MKRLMIVDYDLQWTQVFEREKGAILDAIGHTLVAIEHFGSTAVPGLGAKPIVDILAGLRLLSDTEVCIEPLRGLGYNFRADALKGMPDDRYFERWFNGFEIAHLHLTEHDGRFWRDHILFRDFLRGHPDDAKRYERLKRELAPQHTSGYAYALAKSDFIGSALARARAERGKAG